jgi:RNA polymerase sigma factor (sigma-70 family)
MATVPAEDPGPSDPELIDAVRRGDTSAYAAVYERHVSSAYNLARQLTRSPAETDDLVSEAFAKVLETLRAGRGPDSAFRAYLLTAMRHTAYDKTRRDRRIELTGDSPDVVSLPFTDTAVAGLERTLAAKAFARLPERWQAVLWHTEIEGQSPAEVAPILGLTANGVSSLSYRAREGLRQAYLQVHLAETVDDRCREAADRLGSWVRGGLSKREKAQVNAHLDECARCRALAAELNDANGALRVSIAPLVLGAGTLGYLAYAGTATASVAGVGTAAVASNAAESGGSGWASEVGAGIRRQFLTVAASTAAIAGAIVIGLTAGGDDQQSPPTRAPVTSTTSSTR